MTTAEPSLLEQREKAHAIATRRREKDRDDIIDRLGWTPLHADGGRLTPEASAERKIEIHRARAKGLSTSECATLFKIDRGSISRADHQGADLLAAMEDTDPTPGATPADTIAETAIAASNSTEPAPAPTEPFTPSTARMEPPTTPTRTPVEATNTTGAHSRTPQTPTGPDSAAPNAGEQADGPARREVTVSEVFDGRRSLRSIRDNARNAGEAPFAVLVAVIIRVLCATPPSLTLPGLGARSAPGSLNLYGALAAPSGGGKGEVMALAENCIEITDTRGKRVDVPVHPIGTGEGLVATFAMPEDPDVMPTTCALFDVDEITNLTALSGRIGATLQPTLLSMWSGKTVGNTNASKTTSRRVEGGRYRLGVLAGVQPANAGALLDEAGSGLPQRFVWASMDDPEHDMDTPPAAPVQVTVPSFEDPARSVEVCHQVREALRADKERKREGRYPHPWDSHALQCREIIAVALSLLDGRNGDVTAEDWHLAGLVWQHNRNTRWKCLQGSRDQATEEAAERERVRIGARDQMDDDRMTRAREVIEQALSDGKGSFHRSAIRNGKARRCRAEFDDVLTEMIEARKLTPSRDEDTGAEWVTVNRNTP